MGVESLNQAFSKKRIRTFVFFLPGLPGGKDGVPSKWHLDTVADLKAAVDAFSAARTAKADPPCEWLRLGSFWKDCEVLVE